MKGNIRPIQPTDAELILEWRNTDAVRLNMYNHERISLDSHTTWFKSMLSNDSCKYFIYERDNSPLGVLSFSDIDPKNRKAFWAFYSGATNVRGIGSEMEQLALDYAFNSLNLNKLCCEVLDFNTSVINFHRKFGFKIEGIKKQDYFRDEKFYDIYQLAILKTDYIKTKKDILAKVEKIFNWEFVLSEAKVDAFAEISGDKNLVHLDRSIAVEQGFEDRIAHGALLAAEISRVAAMEYPSKKPIYLSQNLQFKSPVYLDKALIGKALLKTQIGKFTIIEYNIYQNKTLVASCESAFILNDKDN